MIKKIAICGILLIISLTIFSGGVFANSSAIPDATPLDSINNAQTPAANDSKYDPLEVPKPLPSYPAYGGILFGYGNTNWSELVAQDGVASVSTPTSASGAGVAFGLVAGYEFTNYFALEANIIRFPDSKITFAPDSAIIYGPISSMTSKTEAYSIIGKFMIPIFNTNFRAFADVGPAYTHRDDTLANKGRWTPTFGTGVNYMITPHWMTEFDFQYYAGYGTSVQNPAYYYIPFLYTLNLKLVYRFPL